MRLNLWNDHVRDEIYRAIIRAQTWHNLRKIGMIATLTHDAARKKINIKTAALFAPVAQWIECWPPKPKVARSIRAGRAIKTLWFFW